MHKCTLEVWRLDCKLLSSVSVCDERWPEVGAVCIVSILKVNCSKVWQPFPLPGQVPGCKLKQTGKGF